MQFRLTFITGMSLLFMLTGLYLAFGGAEGYITGRYFFLAVGTLGWSIGNRLVELEDRIGELEKQATVPPKDGSAK